MRAVRPHLRFGCRGETQLRSTATRHGREHAMPGVAMEGMPLRAPTAKECNAVVSPLLDVGRREGRGRLVERVGKSAVPALPYAPASRHTGLRRRGPVARSTSLPWAILQRAMRCAPWRTRGDRAVAYHGQLLAGLRLRQLARFAFQWTRCGHNSKANPVSVFTRLSPLSRYMTYWPRRSLNTSPRLQQRKMPRDRRRAHRKAVPRFGPRSAHRPTGMRRICRRADDDSASKTRSAVMCFSAN